MTTPPIPGFVLEFTKMSGAGNDFIVIDNRFYRFTDDELSGFARRFCRRGTGIGADGLLALNVAADSEAHAYRMKYRNADGSLGTMCGNGARCLARFAVSAGARQPAVTGTRARGAAALSGGAGAAVRPDFASGTRVTFESDAGVYGALVPQDPAADVRLFVPAPGGLSAVRTVDYVDPPIHTLHTGTQHAVVFVDDVSGCDVAGLGPRIRHDDAVARGGTNVNFVEVTGAGALRVRTWEKGVEAETLACGTGALASALVAAANDFVSGSEIEIRARGGILKVGWTGRPQQPEGLYLEGPAEVVYRGSVEL